MKAVFVFCEGNHDVTFAVRSLGQVAKATWVGEPIGQLPSPLGPVADPANPNSPVFESLIARRYGRTFSNLSLPAAAHASPPVFDSIVKEGDTIYVLIRCDGDGAAQSAIELLEDMNVALNPAFGTDVKEVAAAFLFDADDSMPQREGKFAAEYKKLLNGGSAPTHGKWVKGTHRVGLYVFHDRTTQTGTLEELLAPLIEAEWSERWQGANSYMNSHVQATDPVTTKRSEWLKAQITVTTQFLCPGDPMSVVIRKPKKGKPGLPDAHFGGPESQALVSFLQGAPW